MVCRNRNRVNAGVSIRRNGAIPIALSGAHVRSRFHSKPRFDDTRGAFERSTTNFSPRTRTLFTDETLTVSSRLRLCRFDVARSYAVWHGRAVYCPRDFGATSFRRPRQRLNPPRVPWPTFPCRPRKYDHGARPFPDGRHDRGRLRSFAGRQTR